MIGKVLGNRYEILEKIGTGGMGDVYKAHDRRLDRIVAIKILKLQYNDDNNFIRKFKRESLAAASISHPNIVSIYDVGSESIEGNFVHYIVMEYIDGKTLKDIIHDGGPISEKRALNYCIQIAEALKIAHSKHIVHRDIKSQNIMVTRDDRVKVTDFGIARVADNTTVTATNAVMGSVHYFSPEQAKGAKVDNRSDIYSLGIVLYEMLTATLPFDADNPVSVALMQVQSNMPRPSDKVRSIDPEVDSLVLKMTRKDPNKRYKDVFDLIRDIKSITITGRRRIPDEDGFDTDSRTSVISTPSYGRAQEKRYVNRSADSPYGDNYQKPVQKPPKKKKKSPLPAILGVLCALFVIGILGYSASKALGGMNHPKAKQKVTVPEFVGQSKSDAEMKANAAGILLDITTVEDSSKNDNEVVEQNPKEGTEVASGSTVTIKVNNLPDSVVVPSVLNMNYEQAKNALKEVSLQIGSKNEEFSDTVPEGKIISQNPNAGIKISKDQPVAVTISKGEDKTPWNMLAFKGVDGDSAKATLENAGMKVKIEYGTSNDVNKGQVYDQSAKVGDKLKKGDTVVLHVSEGTPDEAITDNGNDKESVNNREDSGNESSGQKTVTVQVPDDGKKHRVTAKRVENSKGESTDTVVWNYNQDPGAEPNVPLIGKGKYEIYIDGKLIHRIEI